MPDDVQPQLKDLVGKLSDPMWRLTSGKLYKITVKGNTPDEDLVMDFIPNSSQLKFIKSMWHRNIILKARQRGFTTLIAIMWLDHALFNANARCGIVAQDREAAEVIFRDKVKFAYENLPPALKAAFPLARDSASELLFEHNNSSVRVATSMRSGTIHRLHISEFGKICAKYPEKAKEVVTGSFPAVPLSGVSVVESTAEGREGEFFEMTQRAMNKAAEGTPLTMRDWRFHFFPWWEDEGYVLDDDSVIITQKDNEYFDMVEARMQTKIYAEQAAWYVATRDADFAGDEERMWQEYPSTPEEAFQQSTEGHYYAKQMTILRKQGRLCRIPIVGKPVYTFWDIGNSDGCAIWFMQVVGIEPRFIDYYEAHGEDLAHYMGILQGKGYLWAEHFLPHDADHNRLSKDNKSIKQMLQDLGMKNIIIVPAIEDINVGVQMVREVLMDVYIDEERCKLGVSRLDNYKKRWSERDQRWSDQPAHDINSEGADAFRQYAQARNKGLIGREKQKGPKGAPFRVLDPEMGY